jgi:ribonuclease HII
VKFPENFKIEKDLYFSKGVKFIAGVDEVGRGPLAGPLVVAATVMNIEKLLELEKVILGNNDVSPGRKNLYTDITDSKKISPPKRLKLNDFIITEALSYSITELSNTEIDSRGIANAITDAFEKSVENLKIRPDFIITDAVKIKSWDPERQVNMFSADLKSITVGAASVIAKVYRDKIMQEMHLLYPQYGFFTNKGYGTKQHIDALKSFGPCEIHRKSYNPLASWLG